MEPLTLRRRGATQLTYDLSHQITATLIYPVRSPNGSTIILSGLESGLKIIWRGGRPFKASPPPKGGNPIVNGSANNDVMIIDSDEEEAQPAGKAETTKAEFENHYDEVDEDHPYENILRTLDIPLPSVTHISIPHVPSTISQSTSEAYPAILSDRIVIAAVCKDFTVVLVALPLAPPDPSVTGLEKVGVQVVRLNGHQDLPTHVAITHTSENVETQNRSRSRSRQPAEVSTGAKAWSFLVASTSPTAGGLLLVHEVATEKDNLLLESAVATQRQYLRSGMGCKVYFNPSVSPSPNHTNLLVVYSSGLVKVYQCIQERNVRNPRNRRGSVGTVDSSASKPTPQNSNGRFLLTLYSPLIQSSNTSLLQRKRILDASWVLGGGSVIAVLEDGSWGIWDIEGTASETSSKTNLLSNQTTPAVLSGRALTQLSVKGRLQNLEATKPQEEDAKEIFKPAKLAPMTPHTRKVRSDGLFTTKATSSRTMGTDFTHPTGGISVSRSASRSSTAEESILLFYNKYNIYIPSLQSYLRSQTRPDRDQFDTATGRTTAITSLVFPPDLPQTSITLLPSSPLASSSDSKPSLAFAATNSVPDLLATTPRHLILLCKPIEEPAVPELDDDDDDDDQADYDMNDTSTAKLDFPSQEDQLLLGQGDLDIDGMDRILDGMTRGGNPGAGTGTPTKSRFHGRSLGPGRRGKSGGR